MGKVLKSKNCTCSTCHQPFVYTFVVASTSLQIETFACRVNTLKYVSGILQNNVHTHVSEFASCGSSYCKTNLLDDHKELKSVPNLMKSHYI